MDYAYAEDAGEDRGMPILVMKDRKTKAIAAHVCPKKGVMQYTARAAAKQLQLLGHDKVIIKTDNEAAILDLKRAIMAEKPVTLVPEESPVAESQSNGEVERANQTVQGKMTDRHMSYMVSINILLNSHSVADLDLLPSLVRMSVTYQPGSGFM